MPPDDPQRLLRLKPEGRDVEGEDLVESLVPEVRLLERGRLQHGPASRDVLAVPTRAISIIFFERSIAVIRPLVSRSQTSDTATPCPQPTSSTRSAGSSARVSTAHTNRSEGLLAMPYALPFPNKGRTLAMSYSATDTVSDRATSYERQSAVDGPASRMATSLTVCSWARASLILIAIIVGRCGA